MAGVRKERGTHGEEQRGGRVFIPRESGGWGNAGRLAQTGHANPDGAALGLEAGKGARLTRTEIILYILISFLIRVLRVFFNFICVLFTVIILQ